MNSGKACQLTAIHQVEVSRKENTNLLVNSNHYINNSLVSQAMLSNTSNFKCNALKA